MEQLPWVRRVYHDTPGLTGYSPYEIVFGRKRHEAGPPYEGVTAVAAEEWFERRRTMFETVQRKLQSLQDKQTERLNAKRKEPPNFEPGMWVWYRHPVDRSNVQHPVYTGPWVLKRRLGETSWVLWTGLRYFTGHMSCIRRYLGPIYGGKKVDLAYSKVSRQSVLETGDKEYEVERILKHRWVKGEPEFLTAWKGYPIEEAGWEPLGSFIHRYSSDLVVYAQEHDMMGLPILKHLTAHLKDAEGRARSTR